MYQLAAFILIPLLISAVFGQDNLVRNGDFSDSTALPWVLENSGEVVSGTVTLGTYRITATSNETTGSVPQLVQWGIALNEGEGYLLRCTIKAGDSGSVRVAVDGDGGVAFSDSVEGTVAVGTTEHLFQMRFIASRSTKNGQIRFYCNELNKLSWVAIANVSIVALATPVIQVLQPIKKTRWISGTERLIEWQQSGSFGAVTLSYTTDNGGTWNIITPLASNQKSFWWRIPNSVYGTECRVAVSDTTGTIADTTDVFTIVKRGAVDAGELTKNGDFIDTTHWHLSSTSPARANGGFENDEYVVSIDTRGSEAWQVKLEQPGFTLENGTMYRFSFDAYASHPRSIYANIGAADGNPSWSVYGGDTIALNVTTTKSRYYQTIYMRYPTSGNIRVEFNCGNDTGKVFIDNVSLIKLENRNAFIMTPSRGAVLKSGAYSVIQWHTQAVTKLSLEFSSDSGSSWARIADSIDNSGEISWKVPSVSSDDCFIRIKNALNDSVLGESARFGVNVFGKNVKSEELIVNGSFANNLQGWNTSFNNAQGQIVTTGQSFKIDISQPGDHFAAITLSQNEVPMSRGIVHTLSFKAFANGTRSMKVLVVSETGSVTVMDSTIALPSVEQLMTFPLTAEHDALLRIEFQLGASRAGVFLDDISFSSNPGIAINHGRSRVQDPSRRHFTVMQQGRCIIFDGFTAKDAVIVIYTPLGAEVQKVVPRSVPALWNGTADKGNRIASGSYIAVYTAHKVRQSQLFTVK